MNERLSDSIREYMDVRASQGIRPNTLRSNRVCLDKLLLQVGNIFTNNVTPQHIDAVFAAEARRGNGVGSYNNLRDTMATFFDWCRQRKHMSRTCDPLVGRRRRKERDRDRQRIPVGRFPALLDSAEHPRDRMVLALGLYLFLRQGEVAALRLGDVDLAAGEVRVSVEKKGIVDYMPISAELDIELRRWLTHYAAFPGYHDDSRDWFLCPAKPNTVLIRDEWQRIVGREPLAHLRPTKQLSNVAEIPQRAMVALGLPIKDGDGKSLWEGMHTLRRSGARALFDEMVHGGYDGAMRRCQTMLHHETMDVTEHYIGLNLDKVGRNDAIKGRHLYPSLAAAGVVQIRSVG